MFQQQGGMGHHLRTNRNGRPAGLTDVFLSVKAQGAQVPLLRKNNELAHPEEQEWSLCTNKRHACSDIRPTGLRDVQLQVHLSERAGQWTYGGVPRRSQNVVKAQMRKLRKMRRAKIIVHHDAPNNA